MKINRPKPLVLPVATVPAIVVLALILTTLGLKIFHGQHKVPVLARAVAAGELITSADMADKSKSVSSFGAGEAITKREKIVGHVAQESLAAGTAISSGQLTKSSVTAVGYVHDTVMRFRTDEASMTKVESGERVRLMFAPANDAESAQATVVPAILIEAAKDGNHTTFFVAIDPDDAQVLLELVARSHLIVVKG